MKIKYLLICSGVFHLVILFLSINLLIREPICERAHVDEIDRTKDVVSNEEMARKIVELYEIKNKNHKNYEETNQSCENEDIPYEIEVIYDEQKYEWIVLFETTIPDGSVLDGFYDIGVRRDNGMLSQIPR